MPLRDRTWEQKRGLAADKLFPGRSWAGLFGSVFGAAFYSTENSEEPRNI
jgi:hypothetical protein